ncbi:hypothetical protein HWV62_10807 [Athelia sp. TMB]|nr:hypothetical protein HWV62_10807 [Athelia sp. TMB]
MPPRPQRKPKPSEKAIAAKTQQSAKKSADVAPAGKSAKRKPSPESSPDVEVLDGPPPTSKSSPSKTRVRPSERTSAPSTPTKPERPRPKKPELKLSTPRTPSHLPKHESPPVTPSPSKFSATLVESSEDEPMLEDSGEEVITDPRFFDDGDKRVLSITLTAMFYSRLHSSAVPEDGAQYDSEEYWHQTENARESDDAFINDEPEEPEVQSDDESVASVPVKKSKGKGRATDIKQGSVKNTQPKTIRKSAAVVLSSDDEGSVPIKSEPVTSRDVGIDKRAEIARADRPDPSAVIADAHPKARTEKESKVLKAIVAAEGAVTAASVSKPASTYTYLEDLEFGVRGESSPAVCEVKNPSDEDPGIDYSLLFRILRSWSNLDPPGWGTYSSWKEQCRDIYMKQLKLVWEFQGHLHIRNASRTVPSQLASKTVSGGNTILVDASSKNSVIQFTTILITTGESHLIAMQQILGDYRRVITGIPQIVEWQRMQSTLCMAHRVPSADINMKAGSITFCTAKTLMFRSCGSSPAKDPSKFFKHPEGTASTPMGRSPFGSPLPSAVGKARIPILDGRRRAFNLTDDLLMLDELLPPFEGEVPEGSCVWVGFTSTKYVKEVDRAGMNFNLMWVVVLGTPAAS